MKDMAIRILYSDQKKYRKLEQHDIKMSELTSNIRKIKDNITSTKKSATKKKLDKELKLEKQRLTDYLNSIDVTNNLDNSDISVFHASKEIYE